MPESAVSAKVFAVYLFLAGALLATTPNLLLSLLRIPQPSEVWIRVLGVVALKPFLVASAYTRCVFFVAFTVMGLANTKLMLFEVTDLAGAIWTHLALRADAALMARAAA